VNTRTRLIAGLALVVLTGALIAVLLTVDFGGGEEETAATPTAAAYLFPGVEEEEAVIGFRVTRHETGETVAASTEDGETWQIDEAPEGVDTSAGADAFRIRGSVAGLAALQPNRVLDDVGSLADYGLDEPAYTVELEMTDGQTHTLEVGDMTPTGGAYYARVAGSDEDTVVLVSSFSLEAVLSFVSVPPVLIPTPEATEATGEPAP
jgi:hypothetical protein